MKEINTKIERTYIIIPLLLLLLLAGCNKDPDYIPGLGIQGYRAPISKILFSPLAYDGATVAIEGFARDFAEEPVDGSDTSEDVTTTFKLTDLKGNYIIILLPGQWEIVDNDYLIVGGIYRKNGNELEARQFEIVDFEKKDEKGRDKEIERRDEW
ncbi:MAG: hypothetical protein IH964_05365 [Candidatus Dadabacteria bacterium]|nr:hypothetical protein [Candidatus Dadabacteria bacterium]